MREIKGKSKAKKSQRKSVSEGYRFLKSAANPPDVLGILGLLPILQVSQVVDKALVVKVAMLRQICIKGNRVKKKSKNEPIKSPSSYRTAPSVSSLDCSHVYVFAPNTAPPSPRPQSAALCNCIPEPPLSHTHEASLL